VTCEQGEVTGQNRKQVGLLEEDQALTQTQQQISGTYRWEWDKKGQQERKKDITTTK